MCKEIKRDQLDENTAASSAEDASEAEQVVEAVDVDATALWESADLVGYPEELWCPDLLMPQMANPYWSTFAWNPNCPWVPPHPATMLLPPFLEMPQVAQPKRKKQQSKTSAKSTATKVTPTEAKAHADASPQSDEERTTLMLRNLPNDITRDMLLKLLDDQGFAGKYNFAYLPVDFARWGGFGYAFVNFVTGTDADSARLQFHGFCSWEVRSAKTCEVSWSHPVQGLEENIKRYQNSPVMHELVPDSVRPVLFHEGKRVEFPAPTKRIRAPRVKKHAGGMAMAVRDLQARVDSAAARSEDMLTGAALVDTQEPCLAV